ncbi:hypothetical protein EV182_000556 [Spiromyces aspiralis]|uniref:Uncharacterized protein n=1 Tax=Spiromyces aspiralis TaxID=68401 RepID=A0ACC1HWM8_9FUNG|nr:hypothetical protein EV182_000556 [Spiromyces aspiralis]
MLISTGSPLPSVPSKQVWRGWRPYINISETDCAFCLLANLPGAPKDAIRYDIGPDRCLTITVSTIDNHGWRKGYDGWVVWHYSTDTYQHQCRLPIGLDLDRIQCAIRDEFLFITIPRS